MFLIERKCAVSGRGKGMPKFNLKVVNERLVIDLNKMTEDYSESYGYDGKPSYYDVGELATAVAFTEVELTQQQLDKIMAEYENGGECGWCGEIATELSGPHLMDFVPGEKMCKKCWEHDREMYLGSVGTDIGEFKPRGSERNE